METIKEIAPSVWAFIYDNGRPTGCSRCPYGIEHDLENPSRERANPANPDEGWYDCRLLNQGKYWGKRPGCTEKDWRVSAQNQLIGMLNHAIRHQCDVEAAKALFGRFWAAIWDDRNLNKTGKEIRTEIMDSVSPGVRYEFERLLQQGSPYSTYDSPSETRFHDHQD